MIILISVHVSNITDADARIFDSLQIALYLIPAVNSVLVTYMIAHRIYVGSRPMTAAGLETITNPKLKRILDMVVQSSAIYTVVLLASAAMDTPVPLSQRNHAYLTSIAAARWYIDAALSVLSVWLSITSYCLWGLLMLYQTRDSYQLLWLRE